MKKIIFFTIFFFSLFNIFSRPQINEQNSFCLMGNVLFYEKPDFSVPYKYRSLNHEGGVKLTVLEKDLKHLKNVHVSAIEEAGKITFLHKVKPGSVDKSYGIHVAALAKLPESLIKRADDILSVYEKKNVKKETFTQTSLFELSESEVEVRTNPIEEKVKSINPLEMTPMEALSFLYELKKEIKEKK